MAGIKINAWGEDVANIRAALEALEFEQCDGCDEFWHAVEMDENHGESTLCPECIEADNRATLASVGPY
jgi:hypothetical protein